MFTWLGVPEGHGSGFEASQQILKAIPTIWIQKQGQYMAILLGDIFRLFGQLETKEDI